MKSIICPTHYLTDSIIATWQILTMKRHYLVYENASTMKKWQIWHVKSIISLFKPFIFLSVVDSPCRILGENEKRTVLEGNFQVPKLNKANVNLNTMDPNIFSFHQGNKWKLSIVGYTYYFFGTLFRLSNQLICSDVLVTKQSELLSFTWEYKQGLH